MHFQLVFLPSIFHFSIGGSASIFDSDLKLPSEDTNAQDVLLPFDQTLLASSLMDSQSDSSTPLFDAESSLTDNPLNGLDMSVNSDISSSDLFGNDMFLQVADCSTSEIAPPPRAWAAYHESNEVTMAPLLVLVQIQMPLKARLMTTQT